MKKRLLTAAMILLALFLSACGGLDSTRSDAIKADLKLTNEDLTTAFTEAEDISGMLDAVVAFADRNQLYYYRVEDDAIILVKQASDINTDIQDLTLQCSISREDPKKDAQLVAIVLTTIRNAYPDRKITVFITAADGRDYYGARAIPKKYLKTDNLISINSDETGTLYQDSAQVCDYVFTKANKAARVHDRKAMMITIGGLEGRVGESKNSLSTNPTTEACNILAYCENNHLDYRIHSIRSFGSSYGQPTKVTLVLSFAASDVPKFEAKIEKNQKNYLDKHGKESDISYTCHSTKLPKYAVTRSNARELKNLLYTIRDSYEFLGTGEEEEFTGQNYITNITVTPSGLSVTATSRYKDKEGPKLVKSTYEDLAKLSGFKLEKQVQEPLWIMPETSLLWQTYSPCAEKAGLRFSPKESIMNREVGHFVKKNKDLQVLCLGIDPQNDYPNVEALILYIESTGSHFL